LNIKRILKFIKYFLMMFVSLNFITAIVVILLNPGIVISVLLLALMTAISVIVAARDVGYIRWF
jgi:hypothetical protein